MQTPNLQPSYLEQLLKGIIQNANVVFLNLWKTAAAVMLLKQKFKRHSFCPVVLQKEPNMAAIFFIGQLDAEDKVAKISFKSS